MTRTRRTKKVRWIQHYNSAQKILLVGEGDFSFSACLARAFHSATNMVATSYDSQERLAVKHWSSEAHLNELKRLGCLVLHDVDVKDMDEHPTLKKMKFDRIIFNFPHAGHFPWLCERDKKLIKKHKKLVGAYFRSASNLVSDGGEIHVNHRDDYPYNTWELEKLAGKAGVQLKEKVEFLKEKYPGYHNKRGSDINSNKKFPLGDCYTFKFTTFKSDDEGQASETLEQSISRIVAAMKGLHVEY